MYWSLTNMIKVLFTPHFIGRPEKYAHAAVVEKEYRKHMRYEYL